MFWAAAAAVGHIKTPMGTSLLGCRTPRRGSVVAEIAMVFPTPGHQADGRAWFFINWIDGGQYYNLI